MRARIATLGAIALVMAIPFPASAQPICQQVPVVNDRCPTWVATYDVPDTNGNHQFDEAVDVAVDPSGSRVFVVGGSTAGGPGADVLALAPASGQTLWRTTIPQASDGVGYRTQLALAPDGSALFLVTTADTDILVTALDPDSGHVRWARTYDGPEGGADVARDVAVSPDSSQLYVTGSTDANGGDLLLIGLSTSDGRLLRNLEYGSPYNPLRGWDTGYAVAVSPDGGRVYVAGRSEGASNLQGTNFDLITLALDVPRAHDGPHGTVSSPAWTWVRRFTAVRNAGVSGRVGIAVSEDGSHVVTSGEGFNNFWTVGYAAPGGTQQWSTELSGTPLSQGWVSTADESLVRVDRGRVFVAITKALDPGPLLASYDLATGDELWTARYPAGPPLGSADMVVSPDGRTVYTLASALDAGYGASLAAFDAGSGSQLWVGRLNSATDRIFGYALAISPSGHALFAAGSIETPEVEGQDLKWTSDLLTWSVATCQCSSSDSHPRPDLLAP
ncbi:MAG: PQQ-binding-like beta-propeller repeat protein [Actinomycetota bacterium]